MKQLALPGHVGVVFGGDDDEVIVFHPAAGMAEVNRRESLNPSGWRRACQPRDKDVLLSARDRLGAMQVSRRKDDGLAAAWCDPVVELRKAGLPSFKIIIEIADDCKIPIASVKPRVGVRRVVVARTVANEMRFGMLLEVNAPDLFDEWFDDALHLLVELSPDF